MDEIVTPRAEKGVEQTVDHALKLTSKTYEDIKDTENDASENDSKWETVDEDENRDTSGQSQSFKLNISSNALSYPKSRPMGTAPVNTQSGPWRL